MYPVVEMSPLVERRNLETRPWSGDLQSSDKENDDLENTVINIPLKQYSGNK
jgi:hypothetical protein